MFLIFTASLGLHQVSFKGSSFHTTSFWNIIIQWTSHDDLTEKFAETFSLHSMVIEKKKLVKWQKFKTALCDLTKKLLPSNFFSTQFWTEILHKSGCQIHGWILLKKSITSEFTLFFAVLFTVNGLNWSKFWFAFLEKVEIINILNKASHSR